MGWGSGIYYLATDLFHSHQINVREEQVEFDESYVFETDYGSLQETVLAILPWNLSDPINLDNYAWGEAYYQRYFIHYYNATGKNWDWSLHEIIRRIEIVLNNGDWNGDGEPGYGTDKYTNGEYIEYPVWDGQIFLPVIETARLIWEDPNLNGTYGENATRFIDTTAAIIEKWDRTNWVEYSEGEEVYGYYQSEPDIEKGIYNRLTSLGRVCAEMYRLTGDMHYLDRVSKMGTYFKRILEVIKYKIQGEPHEMYIWPYSEPEFIPIIGYEFNAEDVSHASINIDFVMDCYYLGIVFTREDLERFANTFFDAMFKGIDKENPFSDKIDGFFTGDDYYRNVREGFAKLFKFYRDQDLGKYILLKTFEQLVNRDIIGVGTMGTLIYMLEEEKARTWL